MCSPPDERDSATPTSLGVPPLHASPTEHVHQGIEPGTATTHIRPKSYVGRQRWQACVRQLPVVFWDRNGILVLFLFRPHVLRQVRCVYRRPAAVWPKGSRSRPATIGIVWVCQRLHHARGCAEADHSWLREGYIIRSSCHLWSWL